MKRPAWFDRELPRDWGMGRITLGDGDDHLQAVKTVGKVICGIVITWVFISLFFCLSR